MVGESLRGKIHGIWLCFACLVLAAGCSGRASTLAADLIQPPAQLFLPEARQMPGYLQVESNNFFLANIASEISPAASVDAAAYVSYRNMGWHVTTDPQEGVYLRVAYLVAVLPDEAAARSLYQAGVGEADRRKHYMTVMPPTVQQTMGADRLIADSLSGCQDGSLYAYSSNIVFTPDLYLSAVCRVKNSLVFLWGHTTDNYDGNNAPLPDAVILEQAGQWLRVVTGRLQP